MNLNVYLTGFMGTGKSAVGRALARRLRRPFTDLDAAVERAEGRSVAEIFARRGEAAFRRLERAALARAAKRGGSVVALGGGALLDPRSRALAAKTGIVVRLTCSRRELVRRLRPRREFRPLLAGGSLDARVARLLAARRGTYGGAHLTVSTTRLTDADAAAAIARRLI
jgi:shikimate kinase